MSRAGLQLRCNDDKALSLIGSPIYYANRLDGIAKKPLQQEGDAEDAVEDAAEDAGIDENVIEYVLDFDPLRA